MKVVTTFLRGMFFLLFLSGQASAQLDYLHLFGDRKNDTGACAVNKYSYTLANLNLVGSGNDIEITEFTIAFDPNTLCEPCSHSEPAGWTYAYTNDSTNAKITWTYTGGASYTLPAGSFLYGFVFHSVCSEESVGYTVQSDIGTTGGNVVGPVPVELLMFSANVVSDGIELSWSTASETENAGFELWRSEQGPENGYRKITQSLIPGAGNASDQNDYSFIDDRAEVGKTYFYRLADVDYNGTVTFHEPLRVTFENALPDEFALLQNYPNPFNPSTTIAFELPVRSEVAVKIYNLVGQEIRTLIAGKSLPAGSHRVLWNGRNNAGQTIATGIYIYSLEISSGLVMKKKLVLAK